MDIYRIAPDAYNGFTAQARFGDGRAEISPSFKTEDEAEMWVTEQQAEATKRRTRLLST